MSFVNLDGMRKLRVVSYNSFTLNCLTFYIIMN